ncbi:MAG: triphosphoribosyl-dephospho-CoA synthase [Candidatus Bathyarchaeota archaeon]|nr:MAG: triphosphoribosyl-dephospho-CoA synthase [Candidatus Bathyarchaeota archaeon]
MNLRKHVAEHVSQCLQLALLLEVSAYPKPGNVHRTADSPKTRYEHFLASTVAVAPHFAHAAEVGYDITEGNHTLTEANIGQTIKEAVISTNSWQTDGNTHLGAIILLAPIAYAAGMVLAAGAFSLNQLRKNIGAIIATTTPEDAVAVYEAIAIANPGGLGTAPKLDVTAEASRLQISQQQIPLSSIFQIASSYDSIASEWTNNYPITFDLGYPYFTQRLQNSHDINTAAVHMFLRILSEIPDTLIIRKVGRQQARKVSELADQVLQSGGLTTLAGRNALHSFDCYLRQRGNKLNPGTTADITSAIIALAIFNGYRP